VNIGVWTAGIGLQRLARAGLEAEADLERWIESDPSLLGDGAPPHRSRRKKRA
jgi:hypothetical protein